MYVQHRVSVAQVKELFAFSGMTPLLWDHGSYAYLYDFTPNEWISHLRSIEQGYHIMLIDTIPLSPAYDDVALMIIHDAARDCTIAHALYERETRTAFDVYITSLNETDILHLIWHLIIRVYETTSDRRAMNCAGDLACELLERFGALYSKYPNVDIPIYDGFRTTGFQRINKLLLEYQDQRDKKA
jgi:hypothetical protein